MKWILSLCFIGLVGNTMAIAKDFQDFERYQGKLERSNVEEKLAKFLRKDGGIEHFFSITNEAFTLYSSPLHKERNEPEYVLQFGSSPKEKIFTKTGLKGAKIALDPGHFGGEYAELEKRFIDMNVCRNGTCQGARFDEGTLAFLTALALKDLLEKEGAQVFMTKKKIGEGAYDEDFYTWLKAHPDVWSADMTLPQIFHTYYNPLDLQARADKINAFDPDITLIIHYNADDTKDPVSLKATPTKENYNMVFIPGSFTKNELVKKEHRYDFLRLLVTDEVEKSKKLAGFVLDEFVKVLQVPAVTPFDSAPYLHRACLKVEDGVYARNLFLTRTVRSPLCYGESVLQNNDEESLRLAKLDAHVQGIPCSKRVLEVAEAYFNAVKKYFEESL